ncbi:unnamed protein product [Cylicostephanus goldi]|uniref:Potassium channel domain-containing protein n=1 Tax=Cylicostephanus goldi TaxID=71465 RepID=A0A3P7N7R3_CYLGO|nr:unnamed protein product [Cylicostephanus goldi]
MDPGVHECVERVLGQIMDRTKCADYELEHLSISGIDDCYQNANFDPKALEAVTLKKARKKGPTIEEEIAAEVEKWSFGNALIFAFTSIFLLIGPTIEEEIAAEMEKWSFGNALIFAFTVITTIG